MSTWNLPPGTSTHHIDAMVDDSCFAYSPDGRFQCDLNTNHNSTPLGNHAFHGEQIVWEKREDRGGELVEMVSTIILASWPKSPTDFNEDGEAVNPLEISK
jgi:hypothetical protein